MKTRLYLIFAACCYAALGLLWGRLHRYSGRDYAGPGAGPDVQLQLNWLGRQLRQGAGDATQAWYPEGYFFTHALYGYALVNQALLNAQDKALAERNAREIEWVLGRLESEAGRAQFPRQQAVEYGVFYQGWLNRLVGGLLLIQPEAARDPSRVEQFHRQTQALAQAFARSSTHHLEAYPGGCWPVDNVVALSSLRLHDDLYGTGYGQVVDNWLRYTRAHLDPATGLLPHRIDARTGAILQGARGSSLVLALSLLPDVDPAWSREQYGRFRSLYAQPVLDFVLVREYPRGSDGPGDVDSGPLVWGLSPVASGVALVTARANGDGEMMERLVQLGEVLGAPITWGDEKRYSLGQLAVGDAFLAWGKTITLWRTVPATSAAPVYPRFTEPWYPWTNGIALALAAAVAAPLLRRRA